MDCEGQGWTGQQEAVPIRKEKQMGYRMGIELSDDVSGHGYRW